MSFDPDRMRQARSKLGLSQYELADKAAIPRSMLSSYETGRHIPELKALETIADALNVSTDYLLGRDEQDAIKPTAASVEAAQALAKAQGKTWVEHRGRSYRLRKDGWESVG